MTLNCKAWRDHNGLNILHIPTGIGKFFPTDDSIRAELEAHGGNFHERALREVLREIVRHRPDGNVTFDAKDFVYSEPSATTVWLP